MLNTSAAPPTAIGMGSWDTGLPSLLANICCSGTGAIKKNEKGKERKKKRKKIKGIIGVTKEDNFRVWFSS